MNPPPHIEDKPRRWQRRRADRPGEILTAALDEFVERGFHTTRLEDVAARAGVTKGTIYLYFASKEALFEAAVRQTIEPFLHEAEQTRGQFPGSASDLLRLLTDRYWSTVGSGPMASITHLMLTESCHFPQLATWYAREVLGRGRTMVGQILRAGMSRGEFREVDPDYLCEGFFAVIEMASTMQHTFRKYDEVRLDPRQIIAAHLELMLWGLRPDIGEGVDSLLTESDASARRP